CARRSRRPSPTNPARLGAWRRPPRDAKVRRLQRAPGSVAPSPREGRREGNVIRNIRLLGAALGGLVGLALAASARVFEESPTGGPLLVAWVIAWIVVGFAFLPYLAVVPAVRLIRAVLQLSTAGFVAHCVGPLLRPPTG